MNDNEKENDPKLRPWIEPELEARIVALVLDEASDFEREQLENLIDDDADLAAYRERIAGVHGQIKSLADDNDAASIRPQLPAAIQAELRAAFSGEASVTVPSAEEIPPAETAFQFPWRKVLAIAAAIALMAIIGSMAVPNYSRMVSSEKSARPPQYEVAADAADSYDYLATATTESAPRRLSESKTEATDRGRRALVAMAEPEESSLEAGETGRFHIGAQATFGDDVGDTSTLAGSDGFAQLGHGAYPQEIGSRFGEVSVSTRGKISSGKNDAAIREELQLPQLAYSSEKQQQFGDFDNGMGGTVDGALIDKESEGNTHSFFKRTSEPLGGEVDTYKLVPQIVGGGSASGNQGAQADGLERPELSDEKDAADSLIMSSLDAKPEVIEFDGFINYGDRDSIDLGRPAETIGKIGAVDGTVALGSGGDILLSQQGEAKVTALSTGVVNKGEIRAGNAGGSGGVVTVDGGSGSSQGKVEVGTTGGVISATGGTVTLLGEEIELEKIAGPMAGNSSGGSVVIGAGNKTTSVDASAESLISVNGLHGNGGLIEVAGKAKNQVRLNNGTVDASGGIDGGIVAIGGSFQGKDAPRVARSQNNDAAAESSESKPATEWSTPRAGGDIDRNLESHLPTEHEDRAFRRQVELASSSQPESADISAFGSVNINENFKTEDDVIRREVLNKRGEILAQSTPVGSNPITAGLRSGGFAVTDDSIDGLIASAARTASSVESRRVDSFGIAGVFTDPHFRSVEQSLNENVAELRSSDFAASDHRIDAVFDSQRFDDESSKSNINVHAGGTGWDSPRAAGTEREAIFPITPASPPRFETRSTGVMLEVAPATGQIMDASDPAMVFDGVAKPLVQNTGSGELSLNRDWKSSQDNKEIKVVREFVHPTEYDPPEIPAATIAPIAAKPAAPAPEGLDETITTTEPFSTFSLHVSDVSFKLAQAALAKGEWPEAERIRVEEFVNAFDYGDPLPSLNEKVSCRMEQMIHPFLQQRNLLRISMRTAAAGRSGATPLNLTLVLDNSGSMERHDRRETVRRAFDLLTGQLQPNDKATLIGFAHTPRLLADQISGEKRQQLLQAMIETPSEGGTNLEEALDLAFEKAREQKTEGAQNRIILLTDGAANLGDADPDSLAKTVHDMRAVGIAFDAAGIGADGLNDEILEALTRKGDGRYYLLDRPEDADEGFARQIAGALRPAAMNVKVQIEFNPDRVASYKLLGFEKHRLNKEDFRDDSVDAAEIAAEEAGVAVYQFEPLAGGTGDVGTAFLRFRDMSSGQMVEKSWPITYAADAPRPDQAAPSIQIASVAALFAAKLKGDALGASVNFVYLKQILSTLPEQFTGLERVQQLQQMIEQASNLEGGR